MKHLNAEITNNEGQLSKRREKLAETEAVVADLGKRKKERKQDSDLESKYQAALKKQKDLTQKIQAQEQSVESMKSRVSEIQSRRENTQKVIDAEAQTFFKLNSFHTEISAEIKRRTDSNSGGTTPQNGN